MDLFENHGLAVTSAPLFGPLKPGENPQLPYAQIDHYRVVDAATKVDPQMELYPTLKRVVGVLEQHSYDFVNLSIGPSIPMDDDDVHPWTAKLDPLFSNGKTFASIAVGNSGQEDAKTRLNRIQPPADCVNAFAVGACNGKTPKWKKSDYSSVGHGRSPGYIKPDGVVFGGGNDEPFWTVGADGTSMVPLMGTSFASPYAMRTAIGVRAHLGPVVTPLGLQALLTHHSDPLDHPASDVGWGRLCTEVETLVTCAKRTCHVLYQGDLDPRKFLRAQIPIPAARLDGYVTISATIRFMTDTDPDHPTAYTRSGLEVYFRKDRLKVPAGKKNPKTSGFFKARSFMSEAALRHDAHKWEPVLHASARMRGSTLINPCFDIHYNPRHEGRDAKNPKPIPYAMVISVMAPNVANLYDRILDRYRFQLAPLRPQLELRVPPSP